MGQFNTIRHRNIQNNLTPHTYFGTIYRIQAKRQSPLPNFWVSNVKFKQSYNLTSPMSKFTDRTCRSLSLAIPAVYEQTCPIWHKACQTGNSLFLTRVKTLTVFSCIMHYKKLNWLLAKPQNNLYTLECITHVFFLIYERILTTALQCLGLPL